MQRFIDKKLNFQDFSSVAKTSNKTVRQAFLEQQEQIERMNGRNSILLKDFARQTAFLKDGYEGQFPVDAFQILDLTVNLPLNKFCAEVLVPFRYGGGADSIASTWKFASLKFAPTDGAGFAVEVEYTG